MFKTQLLVTALPHQAHCGLGIVSALTTKGGGYDLGA